MDPPRTVPHRITRRAHSSMSTLTARRRAWRAWRASTTPAEMFAASVCLALTIPILLFSPMLQDWFGFSMPEFTGDRWISPVFAIQSSSTAASVLTDGRAGANRAGQ